MQLDKYLVIMRNMSKARVSFSSTRNEKFLKHSGHDCLRAVSRDMFGFVLRDRLVGFVAIPFGYRPGRQELLRRVVEVTPGRAY